MEKKDITQLSLNLSVLLAIDANLLLNILSDILISDEGRVHFGAIEEAVLENKLDTEISFEEDFNTCLLFVLNDLLSKSENDIVEENVNSYGLDNIHFLLYTFQKLAKNAPNGIIDSEIETIDIKNIKALSIIKEELISLAKEDFNTFLSLVRGMLTSIINSIYNRSVDSENFITIFLAAYLSLFEKESFNKKLKQENVYFELKRLLRIVNVDVKRIYLEKTELLESKKRRKQFELFMENDFKKYDAVYKALS